MRHTISIRVRNNFGVLSRVVGMFSGRGYNIDSLNVAPTLDPEVSHITIVMNADDRTARLVEANLYKLVNVLEVEDVSNVPSVTRDLALIKVRAGHERRSEVMQIAEVFRARVVDVSPDALIF